jgi:hypothetical protein
MPAIVPAQPVVISVGRTLPTVAAPSAGTSAELTPATAIVDNAGILGVNMPQIAIALNAVYLDEP